MSQYSVNVSTSILDGISPLADSFNLFLVQCAIILGTCRLLSLFGYYLRQPRVIFEIVGGIILGPSVIGQDANYLNLIFPIDSLGNLRVVANIGLVLYLFLIGIEMDHILIQSHVNRAGSIAILGMAVPFCVGIGVARVLFDSDNNETSFTSFFVFIGTAFSITAFPVLARIMKEMELLNTPSGSVALGAAALNDAVAWCLLILAISIAQASSMTTAGYVFLCVVGFALVMFFGVKPVYHKLVQHVESRDSSNLNNDMFAFTLICCFLSAWTTNLLGVDSIFGAFIFGLIIPRHTFLCHACCAYIEPLVTTFTLPLYFALSGLNTDITQLSRPIDAAMVLLVCVGATLGKFIGAGVPAKLSGLSWKESSVVAVLMNTRGLIELIVLNLGRDAGTLNSRTFAIMIIMCLVTTFITCPLVDFIYPRYERLKDAKGPVNSVEMETIEEYPSLPSELDQCPLHLAILIEDEDILPGVMSIMSLFQPVLPLPSMDTLDVTIIRMVDSYHDYRPRQAMERLLDVHDSKLDAMESAVNRLIPFDSASLRVFLRVIGSKSVKEFQVFKDSSHLVDEITDRMKEESCNLVLIPWRNDVSVVMDRLLSGDWFPNGMSMGWMVFNPTHLLPDSAPPTALLDTRPFIENILFIISTTLEPSSPLLQTIHRMASRPRLHVTIIILLHQVDDTPANNWTKSWQKKGIIYAIQRIVYESCAQLVEVIQKIGRFHLIAFPNDVVDAFHHSNKKKISQKPDLVSLGSSIDIANSYRAVEDDNAEIVQNENELNHSSGGMGPLGMALRLEPVSHYLLILCRSNVSKYEHKDSN